MHGSLYRTRVIVVTIYKSQNYKTNAIRLDFSWSSQFSSPESVLNFTNFSVRLSKFPYRHDTTDDNVCVRIYHLSFETLGSNLSDIVYEFRYAYLDRCTRYCEFANANRTLTAIANRMSAQPCNYNRFTELTSSWTCIQALIENVNYSPVPYFYTVFLIFFFYNDIRCKLLRRRYGVAFVNSDTLLQTRRIHIVRNA